MTPATDFQAFFRALWGYDPFPWQFRLATSASRGEWPEWIALPTGTGKTSVIDIAVHALAVQAMCAARERTAPVRIVFAVNRRIVVDEAFDRARLIATKLSIASGRQDATMFPEHCRPSGEALEILRPIAEALQKLAGGAGESPLEAYPLRGGTFTDRSWARSAFQPLLLSTTLDQLGSRLLFRGYGVSEFARPIHAALLANDSLLVLDEAHTSRAFSQTLRSVAKLRGGGGEQLQLPFRVVQLTATPPAEAKDAFGLDDDDLTHPVIARRLKASKPVELIDVPGATGAQRHRKLAAAIAEKAVACHQLGHRRILIVVNRVATAEAVREALDSKRGRPMHNATVEVLTGRLRPLNRDALVGRLSEVHQLKASAPDPEVPPLILIATQCIEVGADFDFDALLTELAPLDNLRQRFGRLNRYGRDIPAAAAIFAPEEVVTGDSNDTIYGECLPRVWRWLKSLGGCDFGLEAIRSWIPSGGDLQALLARAPDAPALLPPHLDLLCQTSPEPHVSPDPSLYIHGPKREFPEVSVVIRADLDGTEDPLVWLVTVPPVATEAASIPLHLARQWLANPATVKDESGDAPQESTNGRAGQGPAVARALVWRGGEAFRIDAPEDLMPGDTLIVPAALGEDALAAIVPLPVGAELDQYEWAHLLARDRIAIRFHPAARDALARRLPDECREEFLALSSPLFKVSEDGEEWIPDESLWRKSVPIIALFLARHLPDVGTLRELWRYAAFLAGDASRLRPAEDWKIVPFPDATHRGALLVNRTRVGATPWPLDPAGLGRQGNEAADPVALDAHSSGVAKRAACNAAILPEILAETIRMAGLTHDLGKLDPRFQALLHGCQLHAVEGRELLAKSGRLHIAVEQMFRKRLDLPDGFRHELLSAMILSRLDFLADHPERDLLLHLVASHHGRCRAFAPVVPDPQPEPFEFTSNGHFGVFPGVDAPLAHLADGVTRRFWELTRRFGWWGLPYLESLLRLADQAESAQPS